MSDDTRTMADLARFAMDIQNACNLSGVVQSFARTLSRLRVLLDEQGQGGTDKVNRHPISVLFADKIAHLAGTQGAVEIYDAYAAVRTLADPCSSWPAPAADVHTVGDAMGLRREQG